MSKVRDLPQKTTLADTDLFYVVDYAAGANGGRKISKSDLKSGISLTAAEVKASYESNANTNAYTDAEKAKLAGIEAGATADQIASEVPFTNIGTSLSSADVQGAIEEVDFKVGGDLELSVTSGRIVHYKQGNAIFDGTVYEIIAGDILLSPDITDGYIYVDVDAVVKQTASGVVPPPLTMVLGTFTTNATDVTLLTDRRVKINRSIILGAAADITGIGAGIAASAGATSKLADAAHQHSVQTASAVGLTAASTNAEGTGAPLARASHTHAIATGAPSTQKANQANNAGTSSNLAKADHIHNIPTDVPISVATSSSNTKGTSTSFAAADHVHAVSVANQEVIVLTDDTNVSMTDILMVGMTVTPAAGTYLVMWSGSVVNSANGSERTWVSLYKAGSQVSGSERSIGTSGGAHSPAHTKALITVDGSQAIELHWRVAGGTSTVHQRSLTLIQLSK